MNWVLSQSNKPLDVVADLQEEIHELLSFAEANATIVRLKGGDPLDYSGVSGIAAELGIPLTHRGVATSVRFLTGHSRKGGINPLFVAENAADPDMTLVVYMSLGTLPSLTQKLMDDGLPCDTPALAVEHGTTPLQRRFTNEKT